MFLITTLLLYTLTSFLTIYISIKYSIALWKILLLSIMPLVIISFFLLIAHTMVQESSIEVSLSTIYATLLLNIAAYYKIMFIPLLSIATTVLYLKRQYSLSTIKTFLITSILILCLSILFFIIGPKSLLASIHPDTWIDLLFLSIFYYIILFYYFKKN